MSPPTRRTLLSSAAATATAAVLAGCSSQTTRSVNHDERPANAALDPESARLRHDPETPPIWYSDTETPVEARFRLELCYVSWSETKIDTDYGRHYRDAEVSCERDAAATPAASETVVTALRD